MALTGNSTYTGSATIRAARCNWATAAQRLNQQHQRRDRRSAPWPSAAATTAPAGSKPLACPRPARACWRGTGQWQAPGLRGESYSGGRSRSPLAPGAGNANALGNTAAPVTLNSGTLDLNANSPTVGGLAGNSGAVTGGSGYTLTLIRRLAVSFSGQIVGGMGLTMNSAGNVQTLGRHSTPTAVRPPSPRAPWPCPQAARWAAATSASIVVACGTFRLGRSGFTISGGTFLAGRTASPVTDVNGTLTLQNVLVNVAGLGRRVP